MKQKGKHYASVRKRRRRNLAVRIALAVIPCVLLIVAGIWIHTYQKRIAAAEAATAERKAELLLLDGSSREVFESNREYYGELTGLQDSIDEEKSAVSDCQDKTASMEKNAEQYNGEGQSYAERTLSIQAAVNDLNETKESLSGKVGSLSKSCNELEEQIDALENRGSGLKNPTYIDPEGKIAYLTFDDGPSKFTPEVLDILARYNIKATFFVTYKTSESLVPYYSRIVEEGHTIAIHTATHEYKKIYASFDAWKEDYDLIWNYVYELTGVKCQLYRFPGGSINSYNANVREEIRDYLNSQNIIYYDWNVVNGDGGTVTKSEAYHNVVDNIGSRKKAVILMHDATGKQTTVDALPSIIEALLEKGYQFDKLDETVSPVQMRWQ